MKRKTGAVTRIWSLAGFMLWLFYYSVSVVIIIEDLGLKTRLSDVFYLFSSYIFPIPYFQTLAIFYFALLGFLYFLASYQTLKSRTSGYFWFTSIGFTHIGLAVVSFVFFGVFLDMVSIFTNLLWGILILTYFMSGKVQDEFDLSAKLRKAGRKDVRYFAWSIFLIIFIYCIYIGYIYLNYPLSSGITEKIRINAQEYSGKTREFFDFTLKIPDDMYLADIVFDKDSVFYSNLFIRDRSMGMIVYDYTYFEKLTRYIGEKFDIHRPDKFIRKIMDNRTGVVFSFMKRHKFSNIYTGTVEVDSGDSSKSIFLFKGHTEARDIYEYFIYDKEVDNMICLLFGVEKNTKDALERTYQIVSSYSGGVSVLSQPALSSANAETYEDIKYASLKRLESDINDTGAILNFAVSLIRQKMTADGSIASGLLERIPEGDPYYKEAQKILELLKEN